MFMLQIWIYSTCNSKQPIECGRQLLFSSMLYVTETEQRSSCSVSRFRSHLERRLMSSESHVTTFLTLSQKLWTSFADYPLSVRQSKAQRNVPDYCRLDHSALTLSGKTLSSGPPVAAWRRHLSRMLFRTAANGVTPIPAPTNITVS
jgi:hypothetical protein